MTQVPNMKLKIADLQFPKTVAVLRINFMFGSNRLQWLVKL